MRLLLADPDVTVDALDHVRRREAGAGKEGARQGGEVERVTEHIRRGSGKWSKCPRCVCVARLRFATLPHLHTPCPHAGPADAATPRRAQRPPPGGSAAGGGGGQPHSHQQGEEGRGGVGSGRRGAEGGGRGRGGAGRGRGGVEGWVRVKETRTREGGAGAGGSQQVCGCLQSWAASRAPCRCLQPSRCAGRRPLPTRTRLFNNAPAILLFTDCCS